MKTLKATLIIATFPLLTIGNTFASLGPETKSLPIEAREIIFQLSIAARSKDFAKLRSLMVDEFTWSFGGDGDAN